MPRPVGHPASSPAPPSVAGDARRDRQHGRDEGAPEHDRLVPVGREPEDIRPTTWPMTATGMRTGIQLASVKLPVPAIAIRTAMPMMSTAKKMTVTASRIAAGGIFRAVSQIASGGPFVVVEVVSTPTANPAAIALPRPTLAARGGRRRRANRTITSAPTIEPDRDPHRGGGNDRDHQRTDGKAGNRRGEARPHGGPVDVRPSPLAEQDEEVDDLTDDQHERDRRGGRRDGVQRGPGHEREPEAGRRLDRGRDQQSGTRDKQARRHRRRLSIAPARSGPVRDRRRAGARDQVGFGHGRHCRRTRAAAARLAS